MEKICFELDADISLKAKGTLIVCLNLLERGINPTIENIKKHSADAERSIRTSLMELTELGYYAAIKFKKIDSPGFDWRYEVSKTREVCS